MRIFYIRHAPTEANLSGEMVKNYNEYSILPFDVEKWKKEIGVHLPKEYKLFVSPVKRCEETAQTLFLNKQYKILEELEEFDCSALGEKKFWEISEEEFNALTNLTKEKIVDTLTKLLVSLNEKVYVDDNVVIIGHGFYGRCLYSYWNRDSDTPYNIINSKNFQFKNLDMMYVNMAEIKVVYRY